MIGVNWAAVCKIRMLRDVTPDEPCSDSGLHLYEGMEYDAIPNPLGAISGICANGERLGVRPNDFEFVNAPDWVLDAWIPNKTCISAFRLSELKKHKHSNF